MIRINRGKRSIDVRTLFAWGLRFILSPRDTGYAAEAPLPLLIVYNCSKKLGPSEVRPQGLCDPEFCIGQLPEKEIADSHFSACTNEQIRLRKSLSIKMLTE